MVNIKGLDKAIVLKELYNSSIVLGMGYLQATGRDMTIEEAREILKSQTYFDYLYGKVMKIDLSSDIEFEEWLYDRDNGSGKAQAIIDNIKSNVNTKSNDCISMFDNMTSDEFDKLLKEFDIPFEKVAEGEGGVLFKGKVYKTMAELDEAFEREAKK